MENSGTKTREPKVKTVTKTLPKKKWITDEDVRKRAFELYQKNGVNNHSELDNWLRAERELRGKVK